MTDFRISLVSYTRRQDTTGALECGADKFLSQPPTSWVLASLPVTGIDCCPTQDSPCCLRSRCWDTQRSLRLTVICRGRESQRSDTVILTKPPHTRHRCRTHSRAFISVGISLQVCLSNALLTSKLPLLKSREHLCIHTVKLPPQQ